MATSINPLEGLLPQISTIGQIIGQLYISMFSEFVTVLGKERAEIEAYLLTKVLMDSIFAAQRERNPTADSVLTQVLSQFHPQGNS